MFLRKGVLKIRSKFTGERSCRSAISIKLQSNFIEITLRHECSPVNLLHIFGTPFLKNTSGRLLLQLRRSDNFRYLQFICSIKICDIDLLSEISPTKKILKIFPISFLEVYEESVQNIENYKILKMI